MIPSITNKYTPLGDLKEYVSSPIDYLITRSKRHGETFQFRIAGRKITYTGNPELIKEVLQTKHRSFTKSKAYTKLKLLLGDGLFTSEGDFWLKQRRFIQPAFTNSQLRYYVEKIELICDVKYNDIKKESTINIKEFFVDLTLDIITKCLLGLSDSNETDKVTKHLPNALSFMIEQITSPLTTPIWYPSNKNKAFKKDSNELNNIIRGLIHEKKRHLGSDLLSTLIELEDADSGEKMTEQQLIDETLTIFLAGHETTAITLTWLVYCLLKNKESMNKIYEECKTHSFHELMGNSFTKACINETMRLYSPIWILGRTPTHHTSILGYDLKPKVGVIFSPYILHRNPRFWVNPDQFKPERFLNGLYNEDYFIPFGGGPRQCVGKHFSIMEMIIAIQKMFQLVGKPTIENLPKDDFEYSLTLRPKHEINVQFE